VRSDVFARFLAHFFVVCFYARAFSEKRALIVKCCFQCGGSAMFVIMFSFICAWRFWFSTLDFAGASDGKIES
jgi:hypothetical protein